MVQVAELLADRTGAGAIEEYCTNECLKHVFVSWLGVYDSTSQNSFRHMAAWWMYQEWHEQLGCDVQGFPPRAVATHSVSQSRYIIHIHTFSQWLPD